MIRVEGKHDVSATVLTHSVSPQGIEHLVYEIEYPRLILAELNTHRMLSKNSASSRAIPFNKMVENLKGRPIRFGQANPGMQDKGEEFDGKVRDNSGCPWTSEEWWDLARERAIFYSHGLYEAGYHKQVYNRLTEPFQMMKTVISGTEWNNFFWLRDHDAADPSLAELARVMRMAKEASIPVLLQPGEWALPYVQSFKGLTGRVYVLDGDLELTLDQARKVSAARSAAVSFRNVDYTLEKSLQVYERLVGDERKHASAFEHQATPMKPEQMGSSDDDWTEINRPEWGETWENGVSHADRNGQLWSGNLKGWLQFRKLIDGENKAG